MTPLTLNQIPAANFTKTHRVGMDMVPPYAIYLDGEQVAEYASEEAANTHYRRLINELRESKAAPAVA